ncbi:MAG: hypothetical protein KDM63_17640, partial [Verrucomicrobiae bacterium]|nr:hypothetical protein [Verrucomicrobiae bacterium]
LAETVPEPGATKKGKKVCNVIKASIPMGLKDSEVTDPEGNLIDWVLDPNGFGILTNSTIPGNRAKWILDGDNEAEIPNTVLSYNAEQIDVEKGPYLILPPATNRNQKTYSETVKDSEKEVWNPTLHIGPMGKDDVRSYHIVELSRKSENGGSEDDHITAISVAPVLAASNTALWDKNTGGNDAPNQPLLLPATLTGFLITPIPRKPAQVSDIPLLLLIFEFGFRTDYRFTAAAADSNFTVSASFEEKEDPKTGTMASTLLIEVSGKKKVTLKNEKYVLNALGDSWVGQQRDLILEDLNANGFSTFAKGEVHLELMATKKALTDWPVVAILGS